MPAHSVPADAVTWMGGLLALLASASALTGILTGGGPGRHVVETTRGVVVTMYGEGLYGADTWLVGAGNRGQDVVMLAVEVPILLLALWWCRRGGEVANAALAGVLAFFAYFYVSMVFATAQNRLFPAYVACAGLAIFGTVVVASRVNPARVARGLPDRPGRWALGTYLLLVAGALTLAWFPGMLITAVSGDVAKAVGPYTSAATEALDLGLVVPVAVLAAVLTLRGSELGRALALVMLVVNVCIGALLMGQGAAQLMSGVPLTVGEIIAKMATFAVLTLVAGGLLVRMRLG